MVLLPRVGPWANCKLNSNSILHLNVLFSIGNIVVRVSTKLCALFDVNATVNCLSTQ